MRFMISRRFVCLAVAFCAAWSVLSHLAAAKTVLDNSDWTGTLIALGEYPPDLTVADQYWAQTFTTPEDDTQMRNLQFPFRNSTLSPSFDVRTDGDLQLRLLVTEFTIGTGGFRPGTILYESDPRTIPYIPPFTPLEQVDFALPDIELEPNTQYAFIVDAFTDQNQADEIYPRGSTATANGYDGGTYYYAVAPPGQNGLAGGTRPEHFAGTWYSFSPDMNVDMAFTITFVPEPSTYGLAACGLLLVAAWRGRRWLGGRSRRGHDGRKSGHATSASARP